jgi:hypothetical protein
MFCLCKIVLVSFYYYFVAVIVFFPLCHNVPHSFLLLYMGTMHLLVFFTVYYNAHNVHVDCDPTFGAHGITK